MRLSPKLGSIIFILIGGAFYGDFSYMLLVFNYEVFVPMGVGLVLWLFLGERLGVGVGSLFLRSKLRPLVNFKK